MSADNEPGGGGRGRAGDLPPAYGEAMQNQGEHGRTFGTSKQPWTRPASQPWSQWGANGSTFTRSKR